MSEDTTAAPAQDTSGQNQSSTIAQGAQDQGQNQAQTWRDTLPDELKASPVLAKYQDQTEALKALVEAQKLIGKRPEGVKVPDKDAKPEEVEQFYKALGRPDTPDAYAMPTVDGLPEGYGISPEVEQTARAALHGLGLNQNQFEGAMSALIGNSMQELKKKEEFRVAEYSAFTQEHGDKAEERLKMAHKGTLALGGEELLNALNTTGAGNYRVVYEAMAKYAETHLAEGAHHGGAPGGGKNYNTLPPSERITQARKDGFK